MTASKIGRRMAACATYLPLVAAALCLAAGTGTALAFSDNRPQVDTFYFQQPVSDTVTDQPCFAGQVGQFTGTDTFFVHYNNNPDFFHMAGTDTLAGRIDYPDGTYLVGSIVARIEASANAQARYVKDTSIGRGQATAYAADGSVLGPVTWKATFHATWQDLNENGQIDPGEVHAGIDQVQVLSCP
jgi:hypothetical protein